MKPKPSARTINKYHRWFAIECNNGAWDLTSRPARTPEDDQRMLNMAYAAAYHWSVVGQPINTARADMTLAHAHSLLGHGSLALAYARRCLDFLTANPAEDWDLAFAHLEMALAAAASKDASLHAHHYAEARRLGEAIQEKGDRDVFLEEFARIPASVA